MKRIFKNLLMIVTCWAGWIPTISAQDLIIRGDIQIFPGGRAILMNDLARSQKSTNGEAGEATLKVDPELESILQKAARYQEDGNYVVACQLWQIVLERSGDTLYTEDGQTYYSMFEQVERILASLPDEGLRTYRVSADAQARQLLAQARETDDRLVLAEVVRKYFISSAGDDAAFRLACLDLDRHDFVGALRLLSKIRDVHPDPTPAPEDLLPRIALCHVMLGNTVTAKTVIEQLPPNARRARTAGGLVEQFIIAAEEGRDTGFDRMQADPFLTYRLSPDVPRALRAGRLYAAWQYFLEPPKDGATTYQAADARGRVLELSPDTLASAAGSVSNSERSINDAWVAHGWVPASEVAVQDGLVIYRTPANVTAWPTSGGTAPAWRSVWLNAFELDDATRHIQNIQRAYGGRINISGRASRENMDTDAAIQLFGDSIQQSMTVGQDVVYVIEGARVTGKSNERRLKQNQMAFNYHAAPRRGRNNFLTAYELHTGRVLWTLPMESSANAKEVHRDAMRESLFLTGGGFMGPPVEFGSLLLVPVSHGGAIHVYALDPQQNGRTVWQTYLCDEPESGAEVWSPIRMTLSGSDLFVATGLGVIFILDPATGTVRLAQRYARQGTLNSTMRNFGFAMAPRYDFDGWSEDIVIPYGRELICFVSDSNRIFAIDRTSGRLIWETDNKPLGYKIDYILGIYNHVLYAAGRQTVIAIDLLGDGRMLWGGKECFGGGKSLGRGLLTPSGIFIPVQDSIWQFSLTGKNGRAQLISTATVEFGTGVPVGNLATDGQHLWAVGGYRLYRLEAVSP